MEIFNDVEQVHQCLQQWFPDPYVVQVGAIRHYSLLPEEHALVVNAVIKRQQEFSTGRWLARQGLQKFGLPGVPILMGALKNPLWPDSVMGAISHDGDICTVVLAQKQNQQISGIGIDVVSLPQRVGRMQELAPMFMNHTDELMAMRAFNSSIEAEMLLFSLKESVIKALNFMLDDFIDMREIEFQFTDRLHFSLSGQLIQAEIEAKAMSNYLVTAVKAF